MAVTIFSAQVVGIDSRPIAVEVDISPGLHIFTIVGLADKEVQESRERIGAAIKNLGALAPHKKSQRVIVNLAPADIKKEGPAFDLPIAVGYLLASDQIKFSPEGIIFLGELGLDGSLRKIPGVLPSAIVAHAAGFKQMIVPIGSGAEASVLEGLEIIEAGSLTEVVEHLAGVKTLTPLAKQEMSDMEEFVFPMDFKDIHGQEKTKLALEVAASGGHNVLMSGPPGAGKTILAKSLPSILPTLSFEESLEVTKIYSVAGMLSENNPFMRVRPFRSPHHTSSHTAIVGGGTHPRPGEITLAHRGVLFLDEFPEFDRRVIESLRQPLEERTITVARAYGVETFPAKFILIAAMNPCPCGNFGNPRRECVCSPSAVGRYNKKISGPMLDRIDIHVHTPAQDLSKIEDKEEIPSYVIRGRVEEARKRQSHRFRKLSIRTNAEMGLREIKEFIKLNPQLKSELRFAYEKYKLSARSYHKILKLARTIADLRESENISSDHLHAALQFRPQEHSN